MVLPFVHNLIRYLGNYPLLLCLILIQCGAPQVNLTTAKPRRQDGAPAIESSASGDLSSTKGKRKPCTQVGAKFPDPISIITLTEWLNTLPKPLTIPCVLDLLPRPLRVAATKSELSVQPALGESSPRIFLKLGDVTLTVGLMGDRADAIEVSERVNAIQSAKGELLFPISASISNDQAFREVIRSAGDGSKCAACHFQESAAGGPFPVNAFQSKALRPVARHEVSLDELRSLRDACKDVDSHRCQVLESLFATGVPENFEFPSSWSTMF